MEVLYVTARVPGPARVGFRAAGGPGNGRPSLILCDLLGCRGDQLRGIYTSSCKKAVINVSHSMFVAPPESESRSTAFPSRATVLQFHVRGWTRSTVTRFGSEG